MEDLLSPLKTVCALIVTVAWALSAAASQGAFAGGAGGPGDPYQIATAEQLTCIGSDPNLLDKHYVLVADIDLDPNRPGGRVFDRAVIAADTDHAERGFQGTAFTGRFDGRGHTLSGLRIISADDSVGLFGAVGAGGDITAVVLRKAWVQASREVRETGLLIGTNRGTVTDCSVSGSVTGRQAVGGLIGSNGSARVLNCSADVNALGELHVGGLIGTNDHGTISDCHASGLVAVVDLGGYWLGTVGFGGLVGIDTAGLITSCSSTASVGISTADIDITGNAPTGGLVGQSSSGVFVGCRSSGPVTSAGIAGGLIGRNSLGRVLSCSAGGDVHGVKIAGGLVGENASGLVLNCCAAGAVSGVAGSSIGGLVGSHGGTGAVVDCYAAGPVTGDIKAGGLVGVNPTGAAVGGCYFLAGADGSALDNGMGQPLTDEAMRERSSFVGWDFRGLRSDGTAETWMMPPEGGYPELSILCGYVPPVPVGGGTAGDPYVIASPEDLGGVGYRPDACYRLANDVDLAGIEWSAAVVPLFTGHFDGAGHAIYNLSIRTDGYGGLFGIIGTGAVVQNLRLQQAAVFGSENGYCHGLLGALNDGSLQYCSVSGSVSGGVCAGALVGNNNSGTIVRCAGSGDVIGASCTGGLVGKNRGVIAESYHRGSVAGTNEVGGVAGSNTGLMGIVYSAGSVRGGPDSNQVGAVAGANSGTIAGAFFWNASDAGPDNGLGTPLTEIQMMQPASFTGWDFFGTDDDGGHDVWFMPRQDFPVLAWQTELTALVWLPEIRDLPQEEARARLESAGLVVEETLYDSDAGIALGHAIGPWPAHPAAAGTKVSLVVSSGPYNWQDNPGDGSGENPYEIRSAGQLESLTQHPELWGKHFALGNDIDLAGRIYGDALLAFDTAGSSYSFRGTEFTGSLDGRGFAVRGLTIASIREYVGLFGKIGVLGEVSDLVLENAVVLGRPAFPDVRRRCGVGVMAGENWGTIQYCGSTGFVVGSSETGGLAGQNHGILSTCYFKGSVAGASSVGGLVGQNGAIVHDAYSSARVSGTVNVGGVVGSNFPFPETTPGPDLQRCYACGSVAAPEGAEAVGALAGYSYAYGVVSSAYFLADAAGRPNNSVGTALSDSQMQQQGSFAGWDFVGGRRDDAFDTWFMPKAGYPVLAWQSEYSGLRKIPRVSGLTQEQARTLLEDVGLVAGRTLYDSHRTLPPGAVIACLDRYAPVGASVDIVVSLGPYEWPTDSTLGTKAHPYTIETAGQLESLYDHPELYGSHFILTADLDMAGRTFAGMVVPGPFSGTLDGRGHRIRHLTLLAALFSGVLNYDDGRRHMTLATAGNEDSVVAGLFGELTGRVADLGLEGVEITIPADLPYYRACVGSIAALNSGTIERCCASVTVVGSSIATGGLVGVNAGTIHHAYSDMRTECSSDYNRLGGIAAENHGTISNCYTTGAAPTREYRGAIVEDNGSYSTAGTVRSCLWDMETTGCGRGVGGIGLSTAQMMDAEILSLNGWAGDSNWVIDDHNDYPRLFWEGTPGQSIPQTDLYWLNGKGTPDDPYRIESPAQLARIGSASILWNSYFVLAADLDMAGIDFLPIGAYEVPFGGTFDGQGHVIRNLVITRGRSDTCIGLFACIGARSSTIQTAADLRDPRRPAGIARGRVVNVVIEDASVTARVCVGILSGVNSGAIENCIVAGSVVGSATVGGLSGYNDDGGTIVECGARVKVAGGSSVGGLVGDCWESTIVRSYAIGSVSGGEAVGGLVGFDDGTITDCYATGRVSSPEKSKYIGGLVGQMVNAGAVTRCYCAVVVAAPAGNAYVGGLLGESRTTVGCFWDKTISGISTSPKGTGLSTAEMQTAQPYLDAAWDFVGETSNGANDVWMICEGRDYPRLRWEGIECSE